jgi:hypothetical protein
VVVGEVRPVSAHFVLHFALCFVLYFALCFVLRFVLRFAAKLAARPKNACKERRYATVGHGDIYPLDGGSAICLPFWHGSFR